MSKVYFVTYDKSLIWPILYKTQIRTIEKKIALENDPLYLTNLAADAIAYKLNHYLKNYLHKFPGSKPHIIFLIGPGNNGSDALASLVKLNMRNWNCNLIFSNASKKKLNQIFPSLTNQPCHQDKHISFSGDSSIKNIRFFALNDSSKENCKLHTESYKKIIENADIIVDALFGIGLNRSLSNAHKNLINLVNTKKKKKCTVLSIDIPSGINADTGRPISPGCAIIANETLTFISLKPGLITGVGKDYSGKISLAALNLNYGLPMRSTPHILDRLSFGSFSSTVTNSLLLFENFIPKRTPSFHKGQSGTACIIGGNDEMIGAVILCSRSALYTGCGKTHLLMLSKKNPVFDPCHPEIMCHNARLTATKFKKKISRIDASSIAIGPGLGRDYYAQQALEIILSEVLENSIPAVFDADALAILSTNKEIYQNQFRKIFFSTNLPITIFTPHPGEAANLLATSITDVENDRINAAKKIANDWSSIVILKGAGSIITWPNKNKKNSPFIINPTGNYGLATGGSGDLLTGIIVSLLAQKMDPRYATLASCYWHGLAAEIVSLNGCGPIGLTANELLEEIRKFRNTF